MKIIGIDPGLQKTGWAVITKTGYNSFKYLASGTIKTDPKLPLQDRLVKISNELIEIVRTHSPSSAGIEQTYVSKNFSSSLLLSHARATAILTLGQHNIAANEYQAKTVKKTVVGSGNAEKDQVSRMLQLIFPGVKFSTSDESDALAIAVCHAFHIK